MVGGQSHSGITVPEGDPGALRSVGQTFRGLSGSLERSAQAFGAMPGELSSWRGPASVAFASVAAESRAAAAQGSAAFARQAVAADRLADRLEAAQRRAKEAIADAKDAEKRIKAAKADIAEARARREQALLRAAAAEMVIATTDLVGASVPSGAHAEAAAARAEAEQAEADEQAARKRLERARDDLDQARRMGRDAEQDADSAASAANSAFAAVGAKVPRLAPLGAPASGAAGNPANPLSGVPALVPLGGPPGGRGAAGPGSARGPFPSLRPTRSFTPSVWHQAVRYADDNLGDASLLHTAALPGSARQAEVARNRFLGAGRDAAAGKPGAYQKGLPALREAKRLENSPLVRAANSPGGRISKQFFSKGLPPLDYLANKTEGQSDKEAAARTGLKTGGAAAGTALGGAACGTAAAGSFGLGAATCPVLMGGGGVLGGGLGDLAGDLADKIGVF